MRVIIFCCIPKYYFLITKLQMSIKHKLTIAKVLKNFKLT